MNRSHPLSRFLFQPFLFDVPTGTENPGAPNPAVPSAPPQPNIDAQVQSTIDRLMDSKRVNGDMGEALRVAVQDAHTQRVRAENAERATITPAIQAELDAYRAFGKLDELKARIEKGDSALQTESQRSRADKRAKAVAADGFSAEKVALLNGIDGFEFETRPVTIDGLDFLAGYVKGKLPDGTDFEGRVGDLLGKIAAPILENLKAGEAAAATPSPAGVSIPALATVGGTAKVDPAQAYLNQTYSPPSSGAAK